MATNVKNSKYPVRQRKRKTVDENMPAKKIHRACEKTGCGEKQPFCCLQTSDNCCRDGYTSRWYHMSLGEHFCNECFDHFYRPHKPGFQKFDAWYQLWYNTSKGKPSIKRFVADEVMPYWVKCNVPTCGKWREVRHSSVSPEYIKTFKCAVVYGNLQKNPCSVEEEACVADLSKPLWFDMLSEIPLLKQSPAAPYLKQFCEEGIGLCPISDSTAYNLPKWSEPFADFLNGESLICPNPDLMDEEETTYMSHILAWSPTYLSLRNLIVAVWYMSPNDWLSVEKVSMYVECRGLVRIYLLAAVAKIVHLLTRNGVINFGLAIPIKQNLIVKPKGEHVVIIGSGISGLAAAKHLHNIGIKPTVIEADSQIGGRANSTMETGFGSLWISGLINNPLTILCHQAMLELFEIPSDPVFLKDDGTTISSDVTGRMLHQFSGMTHGALENIKQEVGDNNWFETITKHQQDFHQLASFSADEDKIFDLLLKIMEVEHRANCDELTLKNYEFPKKLGCDGLVVKGFEALYNKLAEKLDIRLNTAVQKISYAPSHVKVVTNTDVFEASRVIVTTPLPVLRDEIITFEPSLPASKIEAMKCLGGTMQENVSLQFEEKFWEAVVGEDNLKFGLLSSENLVFQYFVDVTKLSDKNQPTLVTFINSSNMTLLKGKSNSQIIDLCYDTLKKAFKKFKIVVPKLVFGSVSSWFEKSVCGTYVKVGSHYTLYDEVAKPISDRIFFAGEGTYRKCPNSMTGAYLSGLREAKNVADVICPVVPCKFSLW